MRCELYHTVLTSRQFGLWSTPSTNSKPHGRVSCLLLICDNLGGDSHLTSCGFFVQFYNKLYIFSGLGLIQPQVINVHPDYCYHPKSCYKSHVWTYVSQINLVLNDSKCFKVQLEVFGWRNGLQIAELHPDVPFTEHVPPSPLPAAEETVIGGK